MKPKSFVNLNRRFRKFIPGEDPENAAFESYTASLLGHESGFGWEDLLTRRLVVVLGEAGSGKTSEFRERAKALQCDGKLSFFIPLDQLIHQPLFGVLSNEESEKFQSWLRGNDEATFFLDSVDEAKYEKPADFLSALDHFRKDINENALRRLHILLSSRISQWRPQSDAQDLLDRFPAPLPLKSKSVDPSPEDLQDKANSEEEIFVVQIEPLDRTRVKQFASERGMADPASFIRALDESYAWPFAGRPIDVINLIDYWNTHHKFGSLTELIENDLRQKLKETREPQDCLTPEKVRQGAETLGASVVFCRNFSFRVPDAAYLSKESAIDSSTCLPNDWLPKERDALLNRAIFDSASYGSIRFHDRRLAEYLAAQWITRLMKEGCSILEIEDHLFFSDRNHYVVRPALAPVVAWLCDGSERWNEDIRNRVLKASPTIHLMQGDPRKLPLEYKKKLLDALVEHYKRRDRAWIDSDNESLSRFADPALAGHISEIIKAGDVSADVRIEMLQIVRYGRLTACLDTVLDLIAADTASGRLNAYAVAALRDAGETPHLFRLREIIESWPTIPKRLCALLCEALYPKVIDAAGFVELLRKTETSKQYSDILPYEIRRHLEETITPETCGDLLANLAGLCQQSPHLKNIPISFQFYWIGEVIPPVLKMLLNKNRLTDFEEAAAARALWLLSRLEYEGLLHEHDIKEDFDALTSRHPNVRQLYFWRLVNTWNQRNNDGELNYPIILFSHFKIIKPSAADIDWAITDIAVRKNDAERIIALKMAIDLWRDMAGRRWRFRRRILRAIAGDTILLKLFKKHAVNGPVARIKIIWYRYFKYRIAKIWWWRRRIDPIRNSYIWLKEQWLLLLHIRHLKSGKATAWLSHLVREADRENHSQWTLRSWDSLVKKRGRLITWATKEGCKRVWQQYRPELPHEKINLSQTDPRVIVGLAGIQALVTDKEIDFETLSHEDASLALRYAVNELNGFAPWLSDLARYQPHAVQNILSECIRGEWHLDAKREHPHEVMSALVWHGNSLIHLVRDELFAQFRAGDPPNDSILETALTLLLREPDSSSAFLSELAADRVKDYPIECHKFILWLAVWLQLNADPALKFLQEILPKASDSEQLMVGLCSIMHYDSRHRLPTVPFPDYAEPEHLRVFIPLVYRYVTPKKDINRVGGGTYTPTARDHAQEFRGSLLTHLSKSEGSTADDVLLEFLKEPLLAHLHDYILHLLDQRAEQRADAIPWNPEDIRIFEKSMRWIPRPIRNFTELHVGVY